MPWPVYLAFKHLFPTGKRASFFTVMSVLGVTLGVAVLLVVQSVMNGFAHEYEVNLIRANGHISVRPMNGSLIDKTSDIVPVLESVPGVKFVEPYALGPLMVSFEGRLAPAGIRSFTWPPQFPRTPEEQAAAPVGDTAFPDARTEDMSHPDPKRHPWADVVKMGSFNDLDDKSILIGYGLAQDLGVQLGDEVEVSSPTMLDEAKKDHLVLPTKLKVVGIFETGWTVADSGMVAVTLRTMQKLYTLNGAVEAVEVRLDNDDMDHTLDVATAIEKKLEPVNQARAALNQPPLRAQPWFDIFHDLMKVLWLEKMVMFYIMIFIVIVAAFSIASSLVTSVVRKTREIGMLGALGAQPRQVAMVFCLQGFIIGLVGTLLGIGLSVLLLHYREPIVERFLDPRLISEFYKFLSFPYQFRTGDFVKIIGFTLLITTLAGLLPAWRAARLKPAECLRYE